MDEPEDDDMNLLVNEEIKEPSDLKEMSEEGLLRALMEAQEPTK